MHQKDIKGLKLPGRDETPGATPRRLPEMSCSFTQAGSSKKRERQEEGRVSSNNDVRSDLEELRSTQAVRDWF